MLFILASEYLSYYILYYITKWITTVTMQLSVSNETDTKQMEVQAFRALIFSLADR